MSDDNSFNKQFHHSLKKLAEDLQDPAADQFKEYHGLYVPSKTVRSDEVMRKYAEKNVEPHQPSAMERMLKQWRDAVAMEEMRNPEPKLFTVEHVVWSPKVKWFRPPMWRIFRWAYNIEVKTYKNCYLSGIESGTMSVKRYSETPFTFTASGFNHPAVDKLHEEGMKHFEDTKEES